MLILYLSVFVVFIILRILGGWPLLVTGGGVFTIFCAYMNYDWFMNHYKAAPIVAVFGRDGTRAIYIIAGIALIVMGLTSF
jgi:hypothetical protein